MGTVVIKRIRGAEGAALAHAFHEAHMTKHLVPRRREDFVAWAEEGSLIACFEGEEMVGTCYVKPDGDAFEFGGVFLLDRMRGTGLGAAMGRVAIAAQFAYNAPDPETQLVAHVHVRNPLPRRMLEALGFYLTGEKATLPEGHWLAATNVSCTGL